MSLDVWPIYVTFPLNPYDVTLPLQMRRRFLKALSAYKNANKVDMSPEFFSESAGVSASARALVQNNHAPHSPLAEESLQAACKSEESRNDVPRNDLKEVSGFRKLRLII